MHYLPPKKNNPKKQTKNPKPNQTNKKIKTTKTKPKNTERRPGYSIEVQEEFQTLKYINKVKNDSD